MTKEAAPACIWDRARLFPRPKTAKGAYLPHVDCPRLSPPGKGVSVAPLLLDSMGKVVGRGQPKFIAILNVSSSGSSSCRLQTSCDDSSSTIQTSAGASCDAAVTSPSCNVEKMGIFKTSLTSASGSGDGFCVRSSKKPTKNHKREEEKTERQNCIEPMGGRQGGVKQNDIQQDGVERNVKQNGAIQKSFKQNTIKRNGIKQDDDNQNGLEQDDINPNVKQNHLNENKTNQNGVTKNGLKKGVKKGDTDEKFDAGTRIIETKAEKRKGTEIGRTRVKKIEGEKHKVAVCTTTRCAPGAAPFVCGDRNQSRNQNGANNFDDDNLGDDQQQPTKKTHHDGRITGSSQIILDRRHVRMRGSSEIDDDRLGTSEIDDLRLKTPGASRNHAEKPLKIFGGETDASISLFRTQSKKIFKINHEPDPWRPIKNLVWKICLFVQDVMFLLQGILAFFLPHLFVCEPCPTACQVFETIRSEHAKSFLRPTTPSQTTYVTGYVTGNVTEDDEKIKKNKAGEKTKIIITKKEFDEKATKKQHKKSVAEIRDEIYLPNWPPRMVEIRRKEEAAKKKYRTKLKEKEKRLRDLVNDSD